MQLSDIKCQKSIYHFLRLELGIIKNYFCIFPNQKMNTMFLF